MSSENRYTQAMERLYAVAEQAKTYANHPVLHLKSAMRTLNQAGVPQINLAYPLPKCWESDSRVVKNMHQRMEFRMLPIFPPQGQHRIGI